MLGIVGSASPCFPTSHLLWLSALLGLASAWDIGKRRIPNWLTAAVAMTGLGTQLTLAGWMAALSGAAAGVLAIALLWKPWTSGRIGGGDVKLAGAAAVWVGLPHLPAYLLAGALAGGLVGGICYLGSSASARTEIRVNLTLAAGDLSIPDAPLAGGKGRMSVPYGVAVSIGALAALWTGGG